jgi:hypothetical protein
MRLAGRTASRGLGLLPGSAHDLRAAVPDWLAMSVGFAVL